MRVFITGGTGFIGGHLCARLLERGDEVVALVRSKKKAAALPSGVALFEGDLSIFADPKTVLPEVDVVVHLAGVVAADSLDQYEAINYTAVGDLLACIGRQPWKPKRFLFASSLAAGGPTFNGKPLTEADPLKPVEPYGKAKARAEELVKNAPFPTTSFRPPLVFGPGDSASLTLFRAARNGVGVRVSGDPQRLSFVDVRDLIDALLLMADDRRSGSFAYYTSHPTQTDLIAMWNELGRAVGGRVFVLPLPRWGLYLAMRAATASASIFHHRNQLDAKQYTQMTAPAFMCSSERLRNDLGWAPKHDLADCFANAAEGYRAAGALRA